MTRPKKAETRARLLRAAAEEFANKGIEAASLADIATRAGMTKGAIFSNFESKDDLVIAVIDEFRSPIDFTPFLDPELSFEEQLCALGRSTAKTLRGASRRQVLLDRAIHSYLVRNPRGLAKYRHRLRDVTAVAGDWLEALAKTRGITLPTPGKELATAIYAVMRGMIEGALLDASLLDEEVFARVFGMLAPAVDRRTG